MIPNYCYQDTLTAALFPEFKKLTMYPETTTVALPHTTPIAMDKTDSEVLEGCKALAEFMGYEIVEVDYVGTPEETEWQKKHRDWMDEVELTSVGTYAVKVSENIWHEWEDMVYHDDFNLLMPVWYKFRDLQVSTFGHRNVLVEHMDKIAYAILRQSITEVFKALVEAIKWYNSLKKPTEVGEFFKDIPKGKYDQHYKGEPKP